MQIAVASVAVGDDRDTNARSHAAHRAGLLDNQRGKHIVSPEAADDAWLLQQLTESFGTGIGAHAEHVLPSAKCLGLQLLARQNSDAADPKFL
jgi:hypothetical protein